MKKQNLIIYAGNVTGIGASQVVKNILNTLNSNYYSKIYNIKIYLPNQSDLIKHISNNWTVYFIKRYNNKYLHFLSRTIDILSYFHNSNNNELLINLGDLPLKYKGKQFLLFHNTNLLDFDNKYFSKYFIINKLFKRNIKYVNKIIVQSPIVKNLILNSIKKLELEISVIPMPVVLNYKSSNYKIFEKLNLFYPASYYKHKNFKLIQQLSKNYNSDKKLNIFLTIKNNQIEVKKNNINFNVTFLNQISHEQVFKYYDQSFALFFPSLKESYGLPLIESMLLNKLIICADLPYTRWLCEDEAIYFDPNSIISAINAINKAILKYENADFPNWSKPLKKIPDNWYNYVLNFLN